MQTEVAAEVVAVEDLPGGVDDRVAEVRLTRGQGVDQEIAPWPLPILVDVQNRDHVRGAGLHRLAETLRTRSYHLCNRVTLKDTK